MSAKTERTPKPREPDPAPPRKPCGLICSLSSLLLLSALLVACHACGPSLAELRAATETARARTEAAHDQSRQAVAAEVTARAIAAARPVVAEALASFGSDSEASYLATCRGLLNAGQLEQTLECVHEAKSRGHHSTSMFIVEADALVGLERFGEARDSLFAARDLNPTATGLQDRIIRAFADDPIFLRQVETMERNNPIDQIRSLGGGSTITLKFKRDGETIAAFKPNQTRRQSSYRAEVAAYRLCPILRCGFEVPYSYEVRVERREFMRLYGIASLDPAFLATHEGYASNFVDLIWTDVDGGQYLYGVWKDWVPHFTQFPIEYEDVWDAWVAVEGDPAELELPFAEAIGPLRGRERGRYDELLEEAAGATTRDLARQISNMLVFDFLINNWDRFSGAYYGVNCQWADGHFVSIDNGAGFMTREPERPRMRLHQVSRFSVSMIREIRLMDAEALLPVLFPDPTPAEVEQWEVFLERRAELLEYVDGLIAERGEDAVLFFD